MIRILVDSSSDYTMEEINRNGFHFVPLMVSLGGKYYKDGIELKPDKFYELLINTGDFPKTSQPSPQDFADIFEDVKAKGDEIICILLSLPFPERKTPKNKSIRYFILEKTLFEYYL